MKSLRHWKKVRMSVLTAGVSAALLIPAPPVAEAGIWGTVIQGAIGAIRAQNKYSDVRSQLLDMGNSPVVQKKLFDQDRAKHGQDDSEENRALIDGIMQQLIERGEYALAANSLPFRWGVNADDSFNASCTAADYISVNRGLITALNGDRDELAGVLAHEMIHGLHQHIPYDMAKEAAIQTAANSMSGGALTTYLTNILTNYNAAKNITAASEKDADESGFRLMASAGFNPGGFAAMVLKMPDSRAESILNPDDHPETSNRLKRGLQWLNEYSLGHVEARDDAVLIDGAPFLTLEANETHSAKERACLVAGGVAKGFHDHALVSGWRFAKSPDGSVDFLTDDDAYRHLKDAVREAGLGAKLEALVEAAYAKDRQTGSRETYMEKEQERREKIEKKREEARKNSKENVEGYKQKSLDYNALSLPDLALHEAGRLLACNPSDEYKAWAHAERGSALYQQDLYDDALAELNTAASLAPKAARTYLYRGYTQHALGNYDAAIADSLTAEKLAPGQFPANLRLQGIAYDAKGEDDLALQAFQAYLQKNPKGDVPEKYAELIGH